MFSAKTREEIVELAKQEKIDPAALLAVAEVESGGRAFAIVNGRREPLIRFEGHYFNRLVDPAKRDTARRAGLASSRAGAVKNPRSQSSRWALLKRAEKIDRSAAWQSVSWGVGQVMGSHWKSLGYASVGDLVNEARASVTGQVRLMLRFIVRNRLMPYIKKRDWAGFARRYNGPAYAKNRYDVKMARAYEKHRRTLGGGGGSSVPVRPPSAFPAKGSRGDKVRTVQTLLVDRGFAIAIDGIFGPATDAALRRFQSSRGLAADGIAGPRTMAELAKPDRAPGKGAAELSWPQRLAKWISRLLTLLRR